jgi:hypothetical protein
LLGLMQANQAPDAFLAEATIFSLLQPEELNAFSQEVLVDGGRTWVVSGDAEVIRPQLAERGWEFATDTDAKTLSEVP